MSIVFYKCLFVECLFLILKNFYDYFLGEEKVLKFWFLDFCYEKKFKNFLRLVIRGF